MDSETEDTVAKIVEGYHQLPVDEQLRFLSMMVKREGISHEERSAWTQLIDRTLDQAGRHRG